MDEMETMISEIDTSVSHEVLLYGAGIAAATGIMYLGCKLRAKFQKSEPPIMNYTEFVNSKDQNARFYIDPSVN